MKRPFFIIFILISVIAAAQNNNANPVFMLKPSIGLNGCQIHGDSYDGYNKLGLFAGIAVNGRISDKASFELGFYFSQKGAKHNPKPDKGDYTYLRVNLNYIDLPLSFRYNFTPKYFFTVGPSIAYLINDDVNYNYSSQNSSYTFNKLEVGVNAGVGRKLGNKWFVELRTSNSVTPVLTYGRVANLVFYPNPVARFFNKGLYNNILTLFVSYKLDLKK
jgi:hypothetical protein